MKSIRAYKLESCVVSIEQALNAQKRGADRLEICTNLETDGLTPSFSLVSAICNRVKIPIRVMIRETPAGFDVDGETLVHMIRAINEFKHLPIEGYVLGVMKDRRIDRHVMEELIDHVTPFPITFHRAIDSTEDLQEDIGWLNQQDSIDSILTSGGAVKAMDGIQQIRQIKSLFRGDVLAAGKITPEALPFLEKELHLSWYHGSAIV